MERTTLTEFFHVITADQFSELLIRFPRLSSEKMPLDASLSRILFKDVIAVEDLPVQARSTVDGYAVRAEDTFGASDSIAALLEVAEPVPMGMLPGNALRPGQAAPIPTGGFLPQGADAVVMVEYTNRAEANSVEITRPVTLRTNVIDKGEDSKSGEPLLPAGVQLRFQDIGYLAATGFPEVSVYRRPRVAILSSGDEVVSIERKPLPGQIRDANGHALAAMQPTVQMKVIPDAGHNVHQEDPQAVLAAIRRVMPEGTPALGG